MIQIENAEVVGLEHAIRGMRNPKNSWDKSDSDYVQICGDYEWEYRIGENDLGLMNRLVDAGTDHRKFMRMIVVYLDITAPLYWWKEFDTYKVGTVANSCSTMHKIHAKEFTLEDFSCGHLIDNYEDVNTLGYTDAPAISSKVLLMLTCEMLNIYRNKFLDEKDKDIKKDYWWQMIQLLPSSYNQKRTVMLNYEVLANMYHSRKSHKLDEWREFCEWIKTLPYSELITK